MIDAVADVGIDFMYPDLLHTGITYIPCASG
jgi:hypothetical protein